MLDLETEEAVARAYRQMRERLGPAMSEALVQRQVQGGVEVIVGATDDPTFGPLVLYGSGGTMVEAGLIARAGTRTSFELASSYESRVLDAQWVANFGSTLTDTAHFTFARLDQDVISITARANVTLSPTVSLQLYVQPFIASGSYSDWRELDDPYGPLADLIDRRLHAAIVELLDDPERRAAFDRWVRSTADDLLRQHHHQIGVTVRENLEALETGALVARIEDRVGADLQFIRLNGAVVGGLVGLGIALLRWGLG